jgi:hypothetical protein
MVQRTTGPRHVREMIPTILWQLAVAREAECAQVQP